MPRSYSYEHFKTHEHQNPPRDEREGEKQLFAKSQETPLPGETKIHYGKKYAQTEELAIAHQMNAQLEELAGLKDEPKMSKSMKDDDDTKKKATEMPRRAKEQELPDEMPRRQGAPIGALPPPEARMPAGLIQDVWSDATRYFQMLQDAAKDARVATTQLLRLPLEAAQIAARRLIPRKA